MPVIHKFLYQSVVFVTGRSFYLSLVYVGKARSLPYGGAPDYLTLWDVPIVTAALKRVSSNVPFLALLSLNSPDGICKSSYEILTNSYKSGAQCYKQFYTCNSRISVVSCSVCHWQVFLWCMLVRTGAYPRVEHLITLLFETFPLSPQLSKKYHQMSHF